MNGRKDRTRRRRKRRRNRRRNRRTKTEERQKRGGIEEEDIQTDQQTDRGRQ